MGALFFCVDAGKPRRRGAHPSYSGNSIQLGQGTRFPPMDSEWFQVAVIAHLLTTAGKLATL